MGERASSLNMTDEQPGGYLECLWMLAGVVSYKLCDRKYDCEHCPFDRAIREITPRAFDGGQPFNEPAALLNIDDNEAPGALFYHPCHVWARVEEQGNVRVGMDDFAQRLLGRIYRVTLPGEGKQVERGEACWRISHQSGEVSLPAPVSGRVGRLNAKLAEHPSLINRDAYGEGWAFIVEPVRLEECLKRLHYGQKARAWYETDVERLYQRLNELLTGPSQTGATKQDGGAPLKDFRRLLNADQIKQLIDEILTKGIEGR
jgi:glycine cleavage system H lipoate-binding protein